MANKGFIKDWLGNQILPITRGELVLDVDGNIALNSTYFLAGDGHPGLVTAAERALLSDSSGSGGISDIYTKLNYINNGFKVNGTILNFYDSNGNATPINLIGSDTIVAAIGDNHTINLSLAELTTSETSVSQILKSITVDKYGRVTSVSGAALTNADIPNELSEKTISNSILSGCTTSSDEIGSDSRAVANKYYVDQKFNAVNTVATGALKFGGPLSSSDSAKTVVTDVQYQNYYYKVTKGFAIEAQYMYSATDSVIDTWVDVGDTLIVYPISDTESRFVHIPSGDDITTITVEEDGAAAPALDGITGDVYLQFSSLFDVVNPSGTQRAYISMPQASAQQDGYLSKSDYTLFSSYADNLKVQYESLITTATPGAYSLGTLTVGTIPYIIYGQNSVSSLSLSDDVYNPILTFTETGVDDVSITFKGLAGITVRKTDNDIEFLAANEVEDTSANYLTITDGYKFGVKIGTVTNGSVVNGLTDFAEFAQFRSNVLASGVIFESIDTSLSDTTATYYYGNDALKAAISVTI